MCMIDDGDRAEFSHTSIHKARKEHKCGECFRVITKGELYQRVAGVWEGHYMVNKTCINCVDGQEWLWKQCGGWLYEGIAEDLEEHWSGEAIRSMQLGRLIVGMRRKWRRRDGSLMPPLKDNPLMAGRTGPADQPA